jgi:hypothetical protein
MDSVQKQDSSKIFQSMKVCTKVCIYFAPIFCLKEICLTYKQLSPPPPPEDQQHLLGARPTI